MLNSARDSDALLSRLCELLEDTGPLKISIEDYLGIFADIPGANIPYHLQYHSCDFCMFAKYGKKGFADCFANKRAVNRILQRRKCSFAGLCHLGVLDLVEPVVVDGICIAGLFYGSVALRERKGESVRRIREHCRRRGLEADAFLAAYADMPMISEEDIGAYQVRLKTVASVLQRMIVDSGLPLERYRQEKDAQTARKKKDYPNTLKLALHYIDRSYSGPISRAGVAEHINCNASHLSTLFTRHMGMSFREYVNTLRIGKAARLLKQSDLSAGEIGFRVGYEEQSHFNRCFKRKMGVTPTQYRAGERPGSGRDSRLEVLGY